MVGSSAAMPRPGGACSAYLLQTGSAAVLLDIGPGAVGKLQLATDYARLDAIVISHMHADHFFDLVPLRQGLKYGPLARDDCLPLLLPPDGCRALAALRKAVAPDAPEDFFDAFAAGEYDPAKPLTVKDLRLSFARTRHYIEGFAIRAECDGASVTYSSDTAPCDAVVELAGDSTLFLCEAALGLADERGERGHSSAEEAGEMSRRARVGQLVLTHYGGAYPASALVEAARRRFHGPVTAAEDGAQFSVLGSSRGREN